MASRVFLAAAVLLAGALAFAGGCARTTLKASVADVHGGREATAELDFWDALAEQGAVTNHDAMHALVVSFTGTAAEDYQAHLGVAKKRGWIRADREPPADETARVGWIARAVCLETGLRGGLTMRVFGARERYALRELNHLGWLPSMSRNQTISGLQLIALLSSAEDHASTRPDQPREDM